MTDHLFDVAGKVTLVSGGSRGIGRALAAGFAARGANVIITGRDHDSLTQTVSEIRELGSNGQCHGLVCDVAETQQIRSTVAEVLQQQGRIDVLLNVAGVNIRKPAMEIDEADYEFVTSINQRGAFFMAQEVGRAMATQGDGAIVNVDSLNTYAPLKNVLPYAMTKNAVVAMTRGLALELGPHGVRVNTLAPGFIVTDLSAKLWQDETMRQWGHTNTPLGRLGKPEDMLGAALFMASPAAAFMTGQVIRVDGGFTAGLNWPIPADGGQ